MTRFVVVLGDDVVLVLSEESVGHKELEIVEAVVGVLCGLFVILIMLAENGVAV